MKNLRFRILIGSVVLLVLVSAVMWCAAYTPPQLNTAKSLITAAVEVGPFTLNGRYLSGQGPGCLRETSVGNIIASKKISWTPYPLPGTSDKFAAPRQQHLYWCRGAKLELIDENGRVLSQPDFLCHSLIEFNYGQHKAYFPSSSFCSEGFVFNFTQGITNVMFPAGYAIPFNSNERLKFRFYCLNRTTDRPRTIKCRWTFYFVDDKSLSKPLTALNWFHSGISVLVGGANSINRHLTGGCGGTFCGMNGMTKGADAPNDALHARLKLPFDKNEHGQEITWHWVVPPGRHSWRTLHTTFPFREQGPIHAAGAHLHPYCEKISLIEQLPGRPEKIILTIHSRTATAGGLRITHIDYLTWPGKGIVLDKDKQAKYGWLVTYNNTSGVNQDAMAGVTLYFSDVQFQKPAWAL